MRRLVLLAPFLVAAASGCGGPPQIGGDERSFKAVDALYTAISLRDPRLVDQCAARLGGLRAEEKLSKAAGEALDAIIAEARRAKWEAAQGRLGDFMRGQRR